MPHVSSHASPNVSSNAMVSSTESGGLGNPAQFIVLGAGRRPSEHAFRLRNVDAEGSERLPRGRTLADKAGGGIQKRLWNRQQACRSPERPRDTPRQFGRGKIVAIAHEEGLSCRSR